MRTLRFLVWMLCLVALPVAASVKTHERVLLYPSVDQHGDSLTLSGKISVPAQKPAKGIIIVPHYTIMSNEEAPSNKITADAKYFCDEYVVIVPDYLGYGASGDRVHPYLHGELTARNAVDMYLHSLPLLDSMALNIPLDSIYIVGYSQGGAAALWILKLIEEEFSEKIHVKHCFAGAGPYDIAVTYDESITKNKVGFPVIIPLLVLGTDAAYDLGINRALLFTPALEKCYTKYMAQKKNSIVSISLRMPNHKASHWLTAEARDKTHPETLRMYEGLVRSSLVHDTVCPSWTPKAPVYIFHSTIDNVVSVKCAERLQKCYPDLPNITYDFGKYGNHVKASFVFYPRVREWMERE